MTFQHITAPTGSRAAEVLPADNDRPDRFTLMDTVRRASSALKLKAPPIATLDALLSCLPPKRNHNFVFASNATIAFRRNGISDRTLRRHIAQLAEIGFLARSDSPNRKRFTKHDVSTGKVMRFGFDLSPLFNMFAQICDMAQVCTAHAERMSYLRTKLRTAIARTIELGTGCAEIDHAQRAIRRKLSPVELDNWIAKLAQVEDFEALSPPDNHIITTQMAVAGGQNDRLHHKSNKEPLDSDYAQNRQSQEVSTEPVTLAMLVDACPEAVSYLQKKPETPEEVVEHARRLAPMMGIDRSTYKLAEERLGQLGAAISIWGLLQMQGKIRQIGAYFRSVTSGKRSSTFDPWALIQRLQRQQEWKKC